MTDKKRFYITILMFITILAGIYGIASRYQEPLIYEPTDVNTRRPIEPDRWECEGPACDKL